MALLNKTDGSENPSTMENDSSESTTLSPVIVSEDTRMNGTTPVSTFDPTTTAREESEADTRSPEMVTTSPGDIKPVSEMIIDDPEPIEFDYKQFFTTTEQSRMTNLPDESDEDEALKVIPLEDNEELWKTDDDTEEVTATVEAVSDDESNEDSMTTKVESFPSTTKKITLGETEENSGTGPVPRLKIVEITSVSDEPQVKNDGDLAGTTPSTFFYIESDSTKFPSIVNSQTKVRIQNDTI